MVTSKGGIQAVMAAILGGAFAAAMLSPQGGATMGMMSLWHCIDALQVIQLLSYLNVDYSRNVEEFFDTLGIADLSFVPNSFEYIFAPD